MLSMGLTNCKDYLPKALNSYFFDTNVWLLLFGDVANYQKNEQATYSQLLQSIIDRESTIFLTANVISEFSNVLLRRTFNEWRSIAENIGKDFKNDFVGSDIYLKQVKIISRLIDFIINLPCVQRSPDNFNAVQLNRILKRFKIIDFNDAYIAETCQTGSIKLVTNDKDFFFLKEEIDIISAIG